MVRPLCRRVAIQGALASLVLLAASVARAEDAKAPNYEAIVASARLRMFS